MKKEAEQASNILNRAVQHTLSKKKMLGQFAIVNKNGRPEKLEPIHIPK